MHIVLKNPLLFILLVSIPVGLASYLKENVTPSDLFLPETDRQPGRIPLGRALVLQTYTPHPPISIHSDNDFLSLGFPGTGTVDDPYLISGLSITAASGDLISISDTTFYFRISDNLIDGLHTADWGILFYNVRNGIIERNNVKEGMGDGIGIYSSSNIMIRSNSIDSYFGKGIRLEASVNDIVITDNIIFNNREGGVWIGNSSFNNTVSNNAVYNNGEGISLGTDNADIKGCDNNTITDNTVYDNRGNGIHITDRSNNNLVIGNTAHDNDKFGIAVLNSSDNNTVSKNVVHHNAGGIITTSSSYNIIESNDIHENWGNGIKITDSNSFYISRNVIYDNQQYGIIMSLNVQNTVIHHNYIINNGNQARDDGSNNQWYDSFTSEGNYWSDYNGTGVYQIGGTAGSTDPYPLSADSDGDKIDDWWEQLHGLDPTDPSDAEGDSDGDWVSNRDEYKSNSDPQSPDSVPLVSLSFYHVVTAIIILVAGSIVFIAVVTRKRFRETLVKRLKAPDHITAVKIQALGFKEYPAYELALNDAKEYLNSGNKAYFQNEREIAIQQYEIALSLFLRLREKPLIAETVFIIASIQKDELKLTTASPVLQYFPGPPYKDPVVEALYNMLQILLDSVEISD